uniref:Ig-like domain-containing protein n=1 Tax=Myripristis murdjan TaxID=586833 RepID=A0A667ZMP8_9TELE
MEHLFLSFAQGQAPCLRLCKPPTSTLMCLLCVFSSSGQPHVKVSAWAGENVVLPCEIPPTEDISVEWSKKGLKPDVVYLYRDGCETHEMKNPGRTSLSLDKLVNGDVSLKLSEVKLSDEGKYRCYIPSLGRESIVELVACTAELYVVLHTDDTVCP